MEKILLHPTYFPSIAQMVAVAQAKTVVFEVEDNYQKQTYRNRAYIAHSNGVLLLNVPIKHTKSGKRQKMKEVVVEDNFPWQSHHWKSLQSAYRTSPFFEFYEDELQPLFTQKVTSLLDYNLIIFQEICEMLGLVISTEKTTSYIVEPNFHDLRFLADVKKEKKYPLTIYNQVLQANHGFLNNLSVLDLLFNEGPNALHYLETQKLHFN